MLYLAIILWAAFQALAQKTPQLLKNMRLDHPVPQFAAVSRNGILSDVFFGASVTGGVPSGGLPPGAFPTGMAYPIVPLSSIGAIATAKVPASNPMILSPVVHSGHDTTHLDNVVPGHQHTLHYADDPSQGKKSAQVQYTFHQPSVPLEHISSIHNIQCPSDTEISFAFDHPDLFRKAMDSWPEPGADFVLIDATEGCGKSNQRTFFYVDDYTTDESEYSVRATGRMLSGSDPAIIKGFKVDWQHGGRPAPTTSSRSLVTSAPSIGRRGFFGDIKSHFEDLFPTVVESASTSMSISEAPKATDTSPWGPAKQLGDPIDGVTVYCVDCGVNGNLVLSGSIAASLTKPHIRAGSIDIEATDFNIPMIFEIQAQNAIIGEQSFKAPILQVGLDPFSVPDVFVVGPYVSLSLSFKISLSAFGNLLTGINMTWPHAKAHIDLVKGGHKRSSINGFVPKLEEVWEASQGHWAVNGSLGVPLSLGVGITIGEKIFQVNSSITDTPSIVLSTIFNIGTDYEERTHPKRAVRNGSDTHCTAGVQEIVGFKDAIGLNVADLWKKDLKKWKTQVFSTCIETDTPTSSAPPAKTKRSAPAPMSAVPSQTRIAR